MYPSIRDERLGPRDPKRIGCAQHWGLGTRQVRTQLKAWTWHMSNLKIRENNRFLSLALKTAHVKFEKTHLSWKQRELNSIVSRFITYKTNESVLSWSGVFVRFSFWVITHAGCWENTRKDCKSRAEVIYKLFSCSPNIPRAWVITQLNPNKVWSIAFIK